MQVESLNNLLSNNQKINVATNDNVITNVINNDNVATNHRLKSEVDVIADQLDKALHGGVNSHRFYCKVAYTLSESVIYKHLELALTGNNPQRYFSWLCKHEPGF